MPSIASASSQPISGFSGFPKLRQSVSASGSPPAQATLRAASSTAWMPAFRGSRSPSGGPPLAPRERLGRAAGAHPLLPRGDHDPQSLHLPLARGDAVEADVAAGPAAGHLGKSGREPGPPAVLQRLDEPRLDELERGLD